MVLHTNRTILGILLAFFLIGFLRLSWLAFAELGSPWERALDLLLHDRIFQLVMYDFLFFFIWVFLWMLDHGREHRRTVAPWLVAGLVAAALMIYSYLLTGKNDQRHV